MKTPPDQETLDRIIKQLGLSDGTIDGCMRDASALQEKLIMLAEEQGAHPVLFCLALARVLGATLGYLTKMTILGAHSRRELVRTSLEIVKVSEAEIAEKLAKRGDATSVPPATPMSLTKDWTELV